MTSLITRTSAPLSSLICKITYLISDNLSNKPNPPIFFPCGKSETLDIHRRQDQENLRHLSRPRQFLEICIQQTLALSLALPTFPRCRHTVHMQRRINKLQQAYQDLVCGFQIHPEIHKISFIFCCLFYQKFILNKSCNQIQQKIYIYPSFNLYRICHIEATEQ